MATALTELVKMKGTVTLLIVALASCLQVGWCQKSCPIATAADGSTYNLSYISDRIHQVSQTAGGQVYTYNISICAPAPTGCAGSCSDPNTSGVCQFWGDIAFPNVKCFGSYDTVQVVGLNDGFGVQIIYSGGDVCGACNPSISRTSVITLQCRFDESDPSEIEWTSAVGGEAQMPPFIYFNGTFNCRTGDPKNHITTQFISSASDSGTCNKTDAYMVTVNRTAQCTRGCTLVSNSYVYTECDRMLQLPHGTWVETISSPNTTCETADSAVYLKTDQCAGDFEFSRVTCDENAVYSFTCNSLNCDSCSFISTTPTETCVNGTKYVCTTAINSCNDGLKNYDETDVDCGGPTCVTRCDLHQTCTNDTDCDASGCVEGYCSGPPETSPLESPVPPTTAMMPQSPVTPVNVPLALGLTSSGNTCGMLTGITALISFAAICLQ